MKRSLVKAPFAIVFLSSCILALPAQDGNAGGPQLHSRPPRQAPNEQLLPASSVAPFAVPNPKKYPQKYAAVYMPISLAQGRVRTPEFPAGKHTQWYDIMLQVEEPLPFLRMICMVGVTGGPLDEMNCDRDDPVLQADWTVWEDEHIVQWGSIPDSCGCIFTNKNILKLIGSFPFRIRQEICRTGALYQGRNASQYRKSLPDRNSAQGYVVIHYWLCGRQLVSNS